MAKHKIHPLVEKGEISLSVGVYDALSAKLAEKAGCRITSPKGGKPLYKLKGIAA